MKIIDIVLLVLILVGAYSGYKKGLVVEVISFFALIIAIVTGLKLMHTGLSFFDHQKHDDKWVPFVVFLVIFIVVFLGIYFLGKFLKSLLDYTLFGMFDTWIGAIFGAIKIAFGLSLVLWLMQLCKINFPDSVTNDSFIYPIVQPFASLVVKWISFVIPFQDVFPQVEKAING